MRCVCGHEREYHADQNGRCTAAPASCFCTFFYGRLCECGHGRLAHNNACRVRDCLCQEYHFNGAAYGRASIGKRVSWNAYFLSIANMVATRSTCPRARVGAVVVSQDHKILSTGYNGAPRWMSHCEDIGCTLINDHCINVIHAEVNAFLYIPYAGTLTFSNNLYLTMQPCFECCKLIVQVGIGHVIFPKDKLYEDNRLSQNDYLTRAGVKVTLL